MKKLLSTFLITTALLSSPLVMAASTSSTLAPGEGARFSSNPNDQGHWFTNSQTGEKKWISGDEDRQNVNTALCSTELLKLINNCK